MFDILILLVDIYIVYTSVFTSRFMILVFSTVVKTIINNPFGNDSIPPICDEIIVMTGGWFMALFYQQ